MIGYRRVRCREFNLEELQLRFKHADILMICNDKVIIIEETSRAKIDDVVKVEETIKRFEDDELSSLLRLNSKYSSIYGIIHSKGGVDDITYRATIFKSKAIKKPIHIVNCDDSLRSKISEILGAQHS